MKKQLMIFITLMLVGMLVLAACGGEEEPTPVPTEAPAEQPTEEPMEEPTEEPTEVPTEEPMEEPTEAPAEEPTEEPETATEPELSLTIWADDTRAPILTALAEEFQAAYGVGLNVEQVTNINDQLPIAAPAGEGPDIFIGPHDRLGGWVESGLIAPIDLGAKEGDFVQVGLDAFTLGGELYGMPYAIENMALFRNADLVPDAPETWDDLLAAGQALQESGDVTYAFALEDNGYKVYPVLTSFGGYVFGRTEDGTWVPDDLGIDSEGMIAAGDWIAENVAAGLISPNANDADTAQTLFASGETPFLMTGPWALAQFREAADLNYAISPFPSDGQPFGGIQGFMVNAFSPNILLAQAFLTEFVATDEVMTELYVTGDRPSAYAPVLAATEDPDLVAFGEAGENAALMPAIPEMGAVWGSWNDAVVLVITGEDTPENAFTTAATQIREVLGGATAGMVNVPGSYQAAAGCDGDWDPACEVTALTEGDDGLWTASHEIPAGDYEAKVAMDGAWTVNYGVDGVADGDNYTFSLAADGTVTFSFDPETNILTITVE